MHPKYSDLRDDPRAGQELAVIEEAGRSVAREFDLGLKLLKCLPQQPQKG